MCFQDNRPRFYTYAYLMSTHSFAHLFFFVLLSISPESLKAIIKNAQVS